MLKTRKQSNVVGVDIEAGSIAATEVHFNGRPEIVNYALAPLAPGIFRDGEIVDPAALGESLKSLFSEHKLSRDVRLGIASQRVAVRTLHLPPIDNSEELETAIRFQAQDRIPMPLEQAVLDWEVVGNRGGEAPGVDVVAVAARRDAVATAMEAMRTAGLRPVGIDLSAFGMIRALAGGPLVAAEPAPLPSPEPAPLEADPAAGLDTGAGFDSAAGLDLGAESTLSYEERMAQTQPLAEEAAPVEADGMAAAQPARLYCHLGDVINLAVAQGSTCLFTRIALFGVEGIAQRLAERNELSLEHARQWLGHVGLVEPVDQIEGDRETVMATREALGDGAAKLIEELRVSIEYYGAQERAVGIDSIVACGPGSAIPGLVETLQQQLGFPFTIGRPAALSELDPTAAARLTLSYGLALEE